MRGLPIGKAHDTPGTPGTKDNTGCNVLPKSAVPGLASHIPG